MNYTLYIDETITPNGKRHWQVKGQKTGGCLCVCVCGGGGGGGGVSDTRFTVKIQTQACAKKDNLR